jgi:hypothetical protein
MQGEPVNFYKPHGKRVEEASEDAGPKPVEETGPMAHVIGNAVPPDGGPWVVEHIRQSQVPGIRWHGRSRHRGNGRRRRRAMKGSTGANVCGANAESPAVDDSSVLSSGLLYQSGQHTPVKPTNPVAMYRGLDQQEGGRDTSAVRRSRQSNDGWPHIGIMLPLRDGVPASYLPAKHIMDLVHNIVPNRSKQGPVCMQKLYPRYRTLIDCLALATGGKDSCAIEIAQTKKINHRITRIFRVPGAHREVGHSAYTDWAGWDDMNHRYFRDRIRKPSSMGELSIA